jgi:hypothetical protein
LENPVAGAVHRDGATQKSQANSFGANAWAWFQWGTFDLTNQTLVESLGNAITSRTFQAAIDLSAVPTHVTVYFQSVISNEFGNVLISDYGWLIVPNFVLSSNAITNGLAAGQFDSRMILLTNLYSTNVNFTFTFEGGIPSWVGVNGPLTAVPGVGTGLGLVFNAVNLANGTYRTTLIIDGGPATPDARLEVELKVGPEHFLKPGDLDRNGTVDLLELNTVIQYYRGLLP